ncbi:nuclear transport factor 2 family protein [Bacillus sp. FJAT-27245]|uniref:nuclear transport factor 2 family protein n=1 Tax=Bacillus sp. FJAT-27245 TaxID=1684144 RepID=UPI0006A75FE6|nr:nuclear transport factor 2 family protein [Bacillus sp. FJAT-27245]
MTGFTRVKNLLGNYQTAVYERDVGKFLSGYSADIHMYDCWDSWEVKGITGLSEMVTRWFTDLRDEGAILKVTFTDLVVEENINLAYIHCAVTFEAHNEESGEKLRQITNRFTYSCKKENDFWAITHEHSSIPINGETGEGIFNVK